jgi:hypothetical protein
MSQFDSVDPRICYAGLRRPPYAAAYLSNGGAPEVAGVMAAHGSPCTAGFYARMKERLTRDEVEWLGL